MLKLLPLFIFLFLSAKAFGSHVMGGEITWKCDGNNKYIFELVFYRDCNGAEVNTLSEALRVWNHPTLTTIILPFVSRIDISPVCTTVAGGPLPLDCGTGTSGGNGIGAIEKITYRSAAITIQGIPPTQGWIFTYENFARSNSLTNITSPSTYGITLSAKMFAHGIDNGCTDNSPTFLQAPYFVSCAGTPFRYNMNAVDPDLDSLYIEFGIPYNNFPTGTYNPPLNPIPIPFEPGFTFSSPTPNNSMNPSNVSAAINSSNGEITFNSFTVGNFVVKVLVKSYRQGILIAEVEREMQLVIVPCATGNNAPIFTAPFAGGLYTASVNAGDLVTFNVIANDNEFLQDGSPQTVTLTASGPMFGSNFTSATGCQVFPCAALNQSLPLSGIQQANVSFSWQTSCDHLVNQYGNVLESIPYTFVFRAQDNYCQIPKVNYATIQINVLNPGILQAPKIDCIQTDNAGNVIISWTPINDPISSFVSYQLYSVQNGLLASIPTLATNQFSLSGITTAQSFYIAVVSGCNGNITKYSDTISNIHLDLINPGNGTAVLQWNKPAPTALATFGSYYHIYQEYPAGNFTLIDSVPYNTTQYKDTITICNAIIGYQIVLPNSPCDFQSNIPSDDFEDMLTPSIPTIQSAGFDPTNNNNLLLTWNQNNQADTYGYVVYTFNSAGVLFELDTVWGIGNTSYSYSIDPSQGPYSYSVAAFDSCFTNAVPITFQTSAKSPVNKTVQLNGAINMCQQKIDLSWTAYQGWTTSSYGIYSYELGALVLLGTANGNAASVNVIGGNHYDIYIGANLSNGQIAYSNPFGFDVPIPQQPAFHYLKLASVMNENIDLAAYIDGSVGVKEVIFQRLNSSSIFEEIGRSPLVGNLSTFTDTDVNVGVQSYTYRTQYIDSCGYDGSNGNQATSILLQGVADEIQQINYVYWSPYLGFDGNVNQYEVFSYNTLSGLSQSLGSVNSNQLSYEDVLLSNDFPGEICYYVEAKENVNSYGFSETSRSNLFCLVYTPIIYIPNSFCPSGVNTVFLPILTNIDPKNYSMYIMNRWSNIIFESNDLNLGWDGKINGGKDDAPNDNYLYVVTVQDAGGRQITKRGFVTLIR